MFWSKSTNKTEKDVAGEKAPVLRSGQIISNDGSHSFPPSVEDAVVKEEYIPLELAASTVEHIVSELTETKRKYETYVSQLQKNQEDSLKQTTLHYESYIKELKLKAKRHVEIQEIIKKESEDKLREIIADKENTIESLRDTLAENISSHQEFVANLRKEMSDAIDEKESEIVCLKNQIVEMEYSNKEAIDKLENEKLELSSEKTDVESKLSISLAEFSNFKEYWNKEVVHLKLRLDFILKLNIFLDIIFSPQ